MKDVGISHAIAFYSQTEVCSDTVIHEKHTFETFICKESVTSRQEEAAKTLVEKGCTIIEVEDKAPWQAATKAVLDANISGMEEIYQQILALQ